MGEYLIVVSCNSSNVKNILVILKYYVKTNNLYGILQKLLQYLILASGVMINLWYSRYKNIQ